MGCSVLLILLKQKEDLNDIDIVTAANTSDIMRLFPTARRCVFSRFFHLIQLHHAPFTIDFLCEIPVATFEELKKDAEQRDIASTALYLGYNNDTKQWDLTDPLNFMSSDILSKGKCPTMLRFRKICCLILALFQARCRQHDLPWRDQASFLTRGILDSAELLSLLTEDESSAIIKKLTDQLLSNTLSSVPIPEKIGFFKVKDSDAASAVAPVATLSYKKC